MMGSTDMMETRRTWLKTTALGGAAFLCGWKLPAAPQEDLRAAPFHPFNSLREALQASCSTSFGILPDGQSRQPEGYYSVKSGRPEGLSFDVSNNQIQCSLSRGGLLDRLCILTGLSPVESTFWLRGVFVNKELIRGGPWPFGIRLEGAEPVRLDSLPGTGVDLLGNLFPLFTTRHQNLRLRLLAFAPTTVKPTPISPRAVIVVLQIQNEGQHTAAGAVLAPAMVRDVTALGAEDAREAVVCLDEAPWRPRFPEIGFKLRPGEQAILAVGCMLGETARELKQTAEALRSRSTLDWLNETWQFHAERLGQLSIPGDDFYAGSFVRMEEICRQSVLRLADGSFGAGFWGSDVAEPAAVWNKDNFYAMLPMSMLEPQLCADSILYFLKCGLPPEARGRGLARFPHPNRVTHSLGNALSGLVLAGAYYQMTGDHSFFEAHPEILASARQLLQAVLDSRREKPFLFPSMYVSDGDSRGDFHTGSNLIVWYSFRNMARIAREVYHETPLAADWSMMAGKVNEAIRRHCIGNGPLGKQFFEGATRDWNFILGHDGEESDTTLMPFYGFCEADDPALINHARLALSPQNPYYSPEIDGIWWYDDDWYGATFPGWTTALAGARNETELREKLHHIRQLTDLDGSIWWWPYKHGETNKAVVLREPGKCGWAAAAYLCRFIHDVLGLRLDLPARRIDFRPFCPWDQFTWKNFRLGRGVFDATYQHSQGQISAEITNRNSGSFDGLVEVVLPESSALASCRVNGRSTNDYKLAQRFGRPSVRATATIAPGQALRLEVGYKKP
jgi:hypothetical protein